MPPELDGAEDIEEDYEHASPYDADPSHQSGQLPQKQDNTSFTAGQKRRRVTRACDECRRKKIKCDGKHYDCTYDQPSHRRRNPAPHYVAGLEARLARAEAIIHTHLPTLDINDPTLDARLRYPPDEASDRQSSRGGTTASRQSDANLESMVEATGQLEIDEQGNWDYHGHSSGLSFIRRLREQLGHLEGPEQADDDSLSQRPPRKSSSISVTKATIPQHLHGQTMQESPFENTGIGTDELPSKQLALALCSAALDDACAILNIVHHPTFYAQLERIYTLPQEQLEDSDQKFLPLLYVALALGCLFAKDDDSELEREGYKSATGVGYKYFWAARQLLDVTDCRDLTSLQAILFMIMFLQSSAKLATCYAYIGVALRSALRMGLHRSFVGNFDPIEAECRKRVFWTIRIMDIYVGAMLGLPQTLHDDDIDQDHPTAVTDDCITAQGIQDLPAGSDPPPMAAANANFRLCRIVSKIVKLIYPIKGFHKAEQTLSGTYSVAYSSIKEIERDLQQWMESLPPQLIPDKGIANTPPTVVRMQQLLRMSYAHAQLMLYRPFLHFCSKNQPKNVNARSYACANACVSVSRNIIHITAEMKRHDMLRGSYWFSMYSTFFGVLSLIFFALENPEAASGQNVFADAREGKETLARLAKRSMAADRCTSTLSVLFDQLGPGLKQRSKSDPSSSHKRETAIVAPEEASSTASKSAPPKEQASRSKGSKSKKVAKAQRPQPAVTSSSKSYTQPRVAKSFPPNMAVDSPSTTANSSTFGTPSMSSSGQMSHSGHSTQLYPQRQQLQHAPQMPYMNSQFHHPYPSNLSDVTAVMFPSDNPFAYPNQPMTTLEQNYAFGHQTQANEQVRAMPTASGEELLASSAGGQGQGQADEHMDVHVLGPLPPYMSQGQGNASFAASQWGHDMPPTTGAQMWNQQARSHGLPGMNLDDIFAGEDWQRQGGE